MYYSNLKTEIVCHLRSPKSEANRIGLNSTFYPNRGGLPPILDGLLFAFHVLRDIIRDSGSRPLSERCAKVNHGLLWNPVVSLLSFTELPLAGLYWTRPVLSPHLNLSDSSLFGPTWNIKHPESKAMNNGNGKDCTNGGKTDPLGTEFFSPGNYLNSIWEQRYKHFKDSSWRRNKMPYYYLILKHIKKIINTTSIMSPGSNIFSNKNNECFISPWRIT